MDLRGKPSTFSADGTEKLVGEEGLDGGSLVVSMMQEDNACVRASVCVCVRTRKEVPRKMGDGGGGGLGRVKGERG